MKQAGRFLSKYIKRNFGVFAIYMLLCILCSILSLIAPYISGKHLKYLMEINGDKEYANRQRTVSQTIR